MSVETGVSSRSIFFLCSLGYWRS